MREYERYKIYKKKRVKQQKNWKEHCKKAKKYNINSFDLLDLQNYLKTQLDDTDGIDDIIDESIHSGIDVSNRNKWVLMPIIAKFHKKVYVDEIRQKYQLQ